VVKRLLAFDALQVFNNGIAEDINYDVAHVGNRVGVLLVVGGSLYDVQSTGLSKNTFTWALVLRHSDSASNQTCASFTRPVCTSLTLLQCAGC
jgi:hypothetical protein